MTYKCSNSVLRYAIMNVVVCMVLFSKTVQSNVVCPPLEPSALEEHGPVRVGPEDIHKNSTPLL